MKGTSTQWMDKVTIKSPSQHTNRLQRPSSVRYLVVTPSQQLNNYMFSATNMLKQRQLNILGEQTPLTDRPRMKKNCGMTMKYFQCSRRFQPTHFYYEK
jgi:hypothetical protein